MKKILLITTGGTIASSDSGEGFLPTASGDVLLAHTPEVKEFCDIDILPIMQIDSTNMTPDLMAKMAKTIAQYYTQYDGFVITHGTDTMAYSASLLSYMLTNLAKPVILTGSQIAIGEDNSDAPSNMRHAFMAAADDITGVFIAFGGQLILGTSSAKTKTHSFDGFESINKDYIAHFEQGKILYTHYGQQFKGKAVAGEFCCKAQYSDKVAIIKLSPAMPKEIIEDASKYCDAIVIEGYGMGGVPFSEPNLQQAVMEAQAGGTLMVIASQCLYEAVDLSVYEVGVKMADADILSAGDMTTEAVVTKLMWAFGNSQNTQQARALFLA
ncbi:MAG: asparaginase [Alphaproteobacteria bacterium]